MESFDEKYESPKELIYKQDRLGSKFKIKLIPSEVILKVKENIIKFNKNIIHIEYNKIYSRK